MPSTATLLDTIEVSVEMDNLGFSDVTLGFIDITIPVDLGNTSDSLSNLLEVSLSSKNSKYFLPDILAPTIH